MRNEFALIEFLKKRVPRKLQGEWGIGDDADVFRTESGDWAVSTDAVVENVDFRLKELPAAKAGRKALAVNLSDMAAVGAEPFGFTASLGIPEYLDEQWLGKFYDGMMRTAAQYGVKFLGGDLSRAREFFCSVTIFGRGKSLIRRSGARPGDWLAVTGKLGGSLLRHHYEFTPRVREALFLARRFKPSSMIDVSDGFLQDLGHVLKASRCGAEIDLAALPVSADARFLAKGNPEKCLERALSDGEDFELLFSVKANEKARLSAAWKKQFPKTSLSWVGRMITGKGKIRWHRAGIAAATPKLRRAGFVHFQ